jgi:hypothetical protein
LPQLVVVADVIEDVDGGSARFRDAAGRRNDWLVPGVDVVVMLPPLLPSTRRPSGPKAPEVRRRFTNMVARGRSRREEIYDDDDFVVVGLIYISLSLPLLYATVSNWDVGAACRLVTEDCSDDVVG